GVEVLVELTLNEFYHSRYEAMHTWAERAVADARGLEDGALRAAALAMPALAYSMTGPTDRARSCCAHTAELVDKLSDDELGLRPDAAGWLALAEGYLHLYAPAHPHPPPAPPRARPPRPARPARAAERVGGSPPPASTPSCHGSGTCAASLPRRPSFSTAQSRPVACSGRRRRSPGTSSTARSSRSPRAIPSSRSPWQ